MRDKWGLYRDNVLKGLYRCYIGTICGINWDFIRIMEKEMEATI